MPYRKNVVMEFRRPDRNLTLTAGTGFPDYKIAKVEGLTGLPYTRTTSVNPQIAGVEINNERAEPRVITFEIDCDHDLRNWAISFFNPASPIILTVEWNGIKRWIACRASPVKVVAVNIFAVITLNIELYCPDPYFNDMSNYGLDITFRQELFAFPFVMLADRGLIVSYRVPRNVVTLGNSGDVPVPVRVLFQTFADIENPRITLNGNEFVQVNVRMEAGDTLDINTDPRQIYVRLNGGSILAKTDRVSSYFQLPVGESSLSYHVEGEFDAVSVTVFFTPRYLGV